LLNGLTLENGDAAAVSGETEVVIDAAEDAEFLLFDLA
jgi:quercetin 2,3-dioxygenase